MLRLPIHRAGGDDPGRSADRRAVPPRSSLRHRPAAGRGQAGDATPGQRVPRIPVSLDPVTLRGLLDQGYGVQDAATGTKTDTPLIEVPSTVNVLNRQQLDAQQLLTLPEALQWVPGVFDQNSRSGFDRFTIRGFFAGDSVFLDGLRTDPRFWISQELFGMERDRGPQGAGVRALRPDRPWRGRQSRVRSVRASSLTTTWASPSAATTSTKARSTSAERSTPTRPSPCASTGLYLDRNDFVDFVEKQRAYFAPAVTFKLGSDTTLTVLGSYVWEDWVAAARAPRRGDRAAEPERQDSHRAVRRRAGLQPHRGLAVPGRISSWSTSSTRTFGSAASCGGSTTRSRTTACAASS